jgi:hypothetical protein
MSNSAAKVALAACGAFFAAVTLVLVVENALGLV